MRNPIEYSNKPLPFASDDLEFRFLQVGIPVTLSVLTMVAGVSMMIAELRIEKLDLDASAAFLLVSRLGITSMAILWLVNMIALAICLGYQKTAGAVSLLLLLFIGSSLYLLFILLISLSTCIPRGITNLT